MSTIQCAAALDVTNITRQMLIFELGKNPLSAKGRGDSTSVLTRADVSSTNQTGKHPYIHTFINVTTKSNQEMKSKHGGHLERT
jgi:hypothetical protein